MIKKKEQDIKKSEEKSSINTGGFFTERAHVELIRFDRKVNIYIAVCLILYFIAVGLKWHNSSIPIWNQFANDGGKSDRGLVAGTPLAVRSDEWLVVSSFILAQQKKNFPVSNEALGYGKTALIMGLPTNAFVSIIKPTLWGFYILDSERGFAWYWNFKTFPFLIASFLLLMLFTRNNFILSIFGSIWLFLSSAIQWWSINTELFTFGCLSVVAFIYILYSDKPRVIVANGILFLISSYSFAVVLYPAYQVPLAYFLLALIVGYIIKNKKRTKAIFANKLNYRILTLATSLLALAGFLFLFYQETKDTIEVIANTIYPGKRNEKGGNFPFLEMFTDNFSLFTKHDNFPPGWGNICELSSYLMLSPIATVIIITRFIRTKKADPLLVSILIFQMILYAWLFLGFPEILAKISFFSTSTAKRAFFVLGFSNVIATILFLAYSKSSIHHDNTDNVDPTLKRQFAEIYFQIKALAFIVIFIVVYGINYFVNQQAGSFFSSGQVFKATIIFACLNWLVIYFNEKRMYQVAFFSICLLFIIQNIKINPLSRGLSPYYKNEIFKTALDINAKDPNAGWVVFGQFTLPNFLKAAGINCFNGVQFAPPLEKLHILDPLVKNDSIYNRYAHINFSTLIEGNDSVRFSLVQPDLYSIQMDPCSPRFNQLGIKYFVFTYPPQESEIKCMTPLKDTLGTFIYKRKEL